MPIGAPYNFCNEAGKSSDRHVAGEAVVIDPVRAIPGSKRTFLSLV